MGRRRGRPWRAVVSAVSLGVLAALPGCTASPTGSARPATGQSSGSRASGTPRAPRVPATPRATPAITVTGDHPVLPSGSQDTHAQAAGASCDRETFSADRALGARVATGFAGAGFPAAAALLTHFLRGTGTEVDYRAGSAISKAARASAAFRAVDHQVQAEIGGQLKAGRTRIRLPAGQLPTVAFESGDLYWGFRGTQGLTVTGSVRREHGRYTGTLGYVIRDSYGFPAGDTLAGFGPPMRYLQTVCGAPQQPGGAHWFPDTITVTVPFR
ncbi:MAG TPA: hypothetical protein VGJ19_15095 [Streptosporangiaceae bacterium]